jgi:hypothetical protein
MGQSSKVYTHLTLFRIDQNKVLAAKKDIADPNSLA